MHTLPLDVYGTVPDDLDQHYLAHALSISQVDYLELDYVGLDDITKLQNQEAKSYSNYVWARPCSCTFRLQVHTVGIIVVRSNNTIDLKD
jgi:hypothetical protein